MRVKIRRGKLEFPKEKIKIFVYNAPAMYADIPNGTYFLMFANGEHIYRKEQDENYRHLWPGGADTHICTRPMVVYPIPKNEMYRRMYGGKTNQGT